MQPPVNDRPSPEGRRRNLTVAAILAIAIVGGALLTAALVGDPPRRDPVAEEGGGAEKPRMIPEPGAGRPPDEPGDRGGSEQLLVLALIIVALAAVAGLAWRSSVRARHGASRSEGPGQPVTTAAHDDRDGPTRP